MADKGGWRSIGLGATKCPKCGNDSASLLETTLYRKTRRHIFCAVCAHNWLESERDEDEGDSDR